MGKWLEDPFQREFPQHDRQEEAHGAAAPEAQMQQREHGDDDAHRGEAAGSRQ